MLWVRVRRLGYYDHTQRQLGERALYVFPAKGDATRITCEGPEGVPVLPEDPVARKVMGWDLRWFRASQVMLLLTDGVLVTVEEDVQEGLGQEGGDSGNAR